MMEYRSLGKTGMIVSELGLGTLAFGADAYGVRSHSEAQATIRLALERGVTLFDTAPLYGTSTIDGIAETILGQSLGVDRQRVILATKFGRNARDDGRTSFTGHGARTSVEASLRRINTEWLDVLFLHSPFGAEDIADDVWEALTQLQTSGKVRVIGHSISAFAATQELAHRWSQERKIEVIEVVYSLLNREALPLITDLSAAGIGIIAREVLANGFLSGTITAETEFPPSHLNARYTHAELVERVSQVQQYHFLVRGDIENVPQAALRWALDEPMLSAVLSGARTPKEFTDALIASAAPPFSADEHRRTTAAHTKDFSAT